MNTPIINPVWFYFADVIPNIGFCFVIIGCLILTFAIISYLTDEYTKEFIKKRIKITVLGVSILTVGMLLPSKKACYQIIIAKTITPNNIKAVADYASDTAINVSDNLTNAIKDIMDYSVDRIYNVRNNEKAGD